jgi:hypothetical protein
MKLSSHSRRGGALGLVLFVGVSVVIVMLAGAYLIARTVRVNTTHRNRGDDVSIETPAGRMDIRAHEDLDPASIGLPIYPGATREKNSGAASFEWSSADGKDDKSVSVGAAALFTPDSSSKVLDWYRTQLPNWIVVTGHDGATRFELKEGGHKRIVAIRSRSDGTHIGVASVGEPASN